METTVDSGVEGMLPRAMIINEGFCYGIWAKTYYAPDLDGEVRIRSELSLSIRKEAILGYQAHFPTEEESFCAVDLFFRFSHLPVVRVVFLEGQNEEFEDGSGPHDFQRFMSGLDILLMDEEK